ncbi:bis(5'-nucleosyl)-tetraphosphatase, symmetrical [Deinococcus xinjiangensis]|uniref:Bis(5'-nucleosyl)-tetraphosphatase, symmetrical n=1 Tax=Deinococcus xinjiangensis TaxID=457454 RepID=A0ABP9V673_9DEIO
MASVVVPDLHGCPQFLEWASLRFQGRSLILLGDLINRGPDSRRVLRLALQLARERRATLLWGNHETYLWDNTAKFKPPAQERWLRAHASDLLHSYGGNSKALMQDLTEFALFARSYAVEGEMLCAHAARPSFGRSAGDLLDQGYLTDRPSMGLHPLPTHLFPELRYSVHGHTVMREPVVDLDGAGVVYLDLGSAKTGRFCVWDAESKQVVRYP